MAWTIELHPDAAKSLRSLARKDRPMAKRITDYLADVERADDPRSCGKGLTGPLTGLWRYRIGDWRVVVGGIVKTCGSRVMRRAGHLPFGRRLVR